MKHKFSLLLTVACIFSVAITFGHPVRHGRSRSRRLTEILTSSPSTPQSNSKEITISESSFDQFCQQVALSAKNYPNVGPQQLVKDLLICRSAKITSSALISRHDLAMLKVIQDAAYWKTEFPIQLKKLCKMKGEQLRGRYHEQPVADYTILGMWFSSCLKLHVCGNAVVCKPEANFTLSGISYDVDDTFPVGQSSTTRDNFEKWRQTTPKLILKHCKNVLDAMLKFKITWNNMGNIAKDMAICYVYYEGFPTGLAEAENMDPNQFILQYGQTGRLEASNYLKLVFPNKKFNRLLDIWDNNTVSTSESIPLTSALLNRQDTWNLYEMLEYRLPNSNLDSSFIIDKLFIEDFGCYCMYCSKMTKHLHQASGNVTIQMFQDMIGCLRAGVCKNGTECPVPTTSNTRTCGASNSCFDVTAARYRPEVLYGMDESQRASHCQAVMENLIAFNATSKNNLKQLAYDLKLCLETFDISRRTQLPVQITSLFMRCSKTLDDCKKRASLKTDKEFQPYNIRMKNTANFSSICLLPTLHLNNERLLKSNILFLHVIENEFNKFIEISDLQEITVPMSANDDQLSIHDGNLECKLNYPIMEKHVDFDDTGIALQLHNHSLSRKRRIAVDYANKHFINTPLTYPDTLYLINELNTANPGVDRKEFIEYRKAFRAGQRQDESLMVSIWTVVVKGGPAAAITLIIDHSKHKMKKSQGEILFTVGSPFTGPGEQKFDIDFNDASVQHTSINDQDVLPDGETIPYGIILLNGVGAKTKALLKLPLVDNIKTPLVLNQYWINFIQIHAIDCVFYRSSSIYDHCEIFDELCPKLKRNPEENYMQRDWQGDDETREPDFSISRCVTHPYPFDPFGYKMTTLSPGSPNGPSCAVGSDFLISDNIQYILPLVPGTNEAVEAIEVLHEEPRSCSSRQFPQEVYGALTHIAYKKQLQNEMLRMQGTCGLSGNPNSNLGNVLTGLRTLMNYASQTFPESSHGPYLWNQPISSELYNHVQIHQSDMINPEILKDTNIGWWIGHVPNKDPKLYHFYCKICVAGLLSNALFDRVNSNAIQQIMTPQGMLYTDTVNAKKNNNMAIIAHARWPAHVNFVEFGQERANKDEFMKRKDTKVAALESIPPEERHLRYTENYFKYAMNHLQTNAALTTFQQSIRTAAAISDVYGFLYQNYRGIRKVTIHISTFEHQMLINEVLRGDPLSIMFDGYMDVQGKSYIGMFFFMYIDNDPKAVFYRALPLGLDQSSKGYSTVMIDAMKEDGIFETITHSMVALAADGASVNQARFRSIFVDFQNVVDHPILFQWCIPHRVNLILKPVLNEDQFKPLKENLLFVNVVHGLYGPTTKLRGRLARRLKLSGSKIHYLDRTQETRWAASFARAVGKDYTFWLPIEAETRSVTMDTSIRKAIREKAEIVHLKMLSPHFHTAQCFVLGLFETVMVVSKANQQHHSPAIDQAFSGDALSKAFEGFRESGGPRCKELLEHMDCGTGNVPVTMQDLETKSCKYYDVQLSEPDLTTQDNFKISLIGKLLDRLQAKVIQYFPVDQMKQFQIFDPRFFPLPMMDDLYLSEDDEIDETPPTRFVEAVNQYGEEPFNKLAISIGYNQDEVRILLYGRWVKVIRSITTDPLFMELRNSKPSTFWHNALLNSNYPWTPDLVEFIKKVVVIPSGISQVEALFSEITGILGKDRLQLLPEMVDHLMRVKHRLPKDISTWQPFYHIIAWLKSGKCRTDDTTCSYRGFKIQEENVDDEDCDDDPICDLLPDDDDIVYGLD